MMNGDLLSKSMMSQSALLQQVHGLVLDTAVGNTVLKRAACAFFQSAIVHELFWMIFCRNNLMELVLRGVFTQPLVLVMGLVL